ncbi:hypothetical protein Nocox_12245 [Nonomuraea coxensis DSM 45129]|uniref:FHA domain-containing protein n=1 Tax=Nonomuraea coxensis DSM 45129 TaxID=1122611 RepID=A0ABX8TX92_9ACTN|nr:hypothetical protein [Nonomuraea coxensis]QYC40067.1 hypothetical protein Nocox_12245 [Nonomuraea coxensis DSM 45129]
MPPVSRAHAEVRHEDGRVSAPPRLPDDRGEATRVIRRERGGRPA